MAWYEEGSSRVALGTVELTDLDSDTVPDAADLCPDIASTGLDGCPPASALPQPRPMTMRPRMPMTLSTVNRSEKIAPALEPRMFSAVRKMIPPMATVLTPVALRGTK